MKIPVSKKPVSLHPLEVLYLKGEIESHSNDRAKRALQHLCKLSRSGMNIPPSEINGLESSLLGALVRGTANEKVRRWSLSAISCVGRPATCLGAVEWVLQTQQSEPQVMSAAVAAIYKLTPKTAELSLSKGGLVDPNIAYLSALQVVAPGSLSLTIPSLDFENCDSLVIKLALLLVGMNKSPSNLFHPKYSNREMIRILSTSKDDLVAQYSFWAASENPYLKSADIALDLSDIEGRSENQKSYIYRLYASDDSYSEAQHQVIMLGSDDAYSEARLGCAIGIYNTWFDGIEEITQSWYFKEEDDETRMCLLDHFVRQSNKSEIYYDLAVELYNDFENDRTVTKRMLAHASRLPISNDFKKIDFQRESGFLFPPEVINMTNNNNFTFNNPNFQGQTAMGGSENTNHGTQTNSSTQDNRSIVGAALVEAKRDVAELPIEEDLKLKTLEALRAAEEDPSSARLEKAAKFLETCEKSVSAIAGMATKAKAIGGYAIALLQNLQ